jgi:hypothetical protein
VTLVLSPEEINPERLASLSALIQQYPGDAPVLFHVEEEGRYIEVLAGGQFLIAPSLALKEGLESLLGERRVYFQNGDRW